MISARTYITFLALAAGWALLYIGGAHITLYFVAFGAALLAWVFKELQAYETGPAPNRAQARVQRRVVEDEEDDDWYEEMHARIYPGSPYAEAAFLGD